MATTLRGSSEIGRSEVEEQIPLLIFYTCYVPPRPLVTNPSHFEIYFLLRYPQCSVYPVMYRCEYNSLSLTNHVINQDIFFTLLVSDPKRVGSTGRQKQGYRPQKRHSRDFSRTKFWLSNCNGERIAGALLSNQIEYFEMLYVV